MLKEISVESGGFSFVVSRRLEESDVSREPSYYFYGYVPFLVMTGVSEVEPEIIFCHESIIDRIKEECHQNVLAVGSAQINRQKGKITHIYVSSKTDSALQERKAWLETVLARINSYLLDESVRLSVDNREYWSYDLPPDWYIKHPKTEIFPLK